MGTCCAQDQTGVGTSVQELQVALPEEPEAGGEDPVVGGPGGGGVAAEPGGLQCHARM